MPTDGAVTALAPATALVANDRVTFEQVYSKFAPTVVRWAARLGNGALDAEDVTHDVFLTVQRLLPRVSHDRPLEPWLYRLTANAVRNARRRKRVREWFARWFAPSEGEAPSASQVMENEELRAGLRQALDGLRDRHREVLVLFELEGRSAVEVAQLMKTTEENVWVLVHRARKALKARAGHLLELELEP